MNAIDNLLKADTKPIEKFGNVKNRIISNTNSDDNHIIHFRSVLYPHHIYRFNDCDRINFDYPLKRMKNIIILTECAR